MSKLFYICLCALFANLCAENRYNVMMTFVDEYPILIELCQPSFNKTKNTLSGQSLVPILNSVDTHGRDSALSFWGNAVSTRTQNYRIIAMKSTKSDYSKIELYDHRVDPEESKNIACKNPVVVEELLNIIKKENKL